MKIAHVIWTLDPIGGGPPQVAARLAAAQALLGHEVHLVTYGQDDSVAAERTRHELEHVPFLDRVVLHTLPAANARERLFATRGNALLKALVPSVDWLHLHGVWEPVLHRAASLARKGGVPYCFRPAGMLDPWSLRQKAWKKRLALAAGVRRALDRASFIHALNEDEAKLIAPLGLRSCCVVLPNGVFLEEIEPLPAPGTFVARYPQLRAKRFVLFLGRLHYKKGLDYLGAAWSELAARVPDARLVVAGPDEGAARPFAEQVARSGAADRVHVVGPMYGADKFAALVDCACFCLPSRQEGFSVAVLEAMACGAPVVISEHCHFAEAAAAGAADIVALDPGSLADALRRVLTDFDRMKAMGEAGEHLIRRDYTWPVIAERVVNAYRAQKALLRR